MARSPKLLSAPITYWHMEWDAQTYIHGEDRSVPMSFDLPYATLLRLLVTPTGGLKNQNQIADYFKEEAIKDLDRTTKYLEGFFAKLDADCRPGATDLAVNDDKKGNDFDFPRPSPSWMMIREFCFMLRQEPLLHSFTSEHCRNFMR